jgi:hypothetical protein
VYKEYSLRCTGIEVNELNKATNTRKNGYLLYVKLEVPAEIVPVALTKLEMEG